MRRRMQEGKMGIKIMVITCEAVDSLLHRSVPVIRGGLASKSYALCKTKRTEGNIIWEPGRLPSIVNNPELSIWGLFYFKYGG